MKSAYFRPHPLALLALPLFALSACGGGGDTISDAIADVTKGVWLDKYEDSCAGSGSTKNVDVASGGTVKMSIRVNTTGDVEPLSSEWFTEGSGWQTVLGTGSTPSLINQGDGTGRFFSLPVVVKGTGDMEFRLVIKDKKGDQRYEDRCKVHVNIK